MDPRERTFSQGPASFLRHRYCHAPRRVWNLYSALGMGLRMFIQVIKRKPEVRIEEFDTDVLRVREGSAGRWREHMLIRRRTQGKTAYFAGPYLSLLPGYHAKGRIPFHGYATMHFALELVNRVAPESLQRFHLGT